MDIAPEAGILPPSPENPAEVPHPITQCHHIPGRRPPTGRIRHYLVGQRDFQVDRYEGHGLTREQVVAELVSTLGSPDPAPEGERDQFESNGFDQAVWEGDRVVAVLHAVGDRYGSHDVTYFDRAEPPPRPRVEPWRPRPDFMSRPCWLVAHRDHAQYLTHREGTTLEEVVREASEGDLTEDLTVWEDARLVAYIRAVPGGKAEATILHEESTP